MVMGARRCDYKSRIGRHYLCHILYYNKKPCGLWSLYFTKTVAGYIDVKQQEPNEKLQNRVEVDVSIDS